MHTPVQERNNGPVPWESLDANTCGCGLLSAAPSVGPFLRFGGCVADEDGGMLWTGSALYIEQVRGAAACCCCCCCGWPGGWEERRGRGGGRGSEGGGLGWW